MNLGRHLLRAWPAWLALALALLAPAAIAQAESPGGGRGVLEQARVLPENGQLLVSGWAGTDQPNVFTTQLILRLDGREIHRGRFERAERPDVAASTGRPDWLATGFSVRAALPASSKPGSRSLSAAMRLGNGAEVELAIAPAAREVQVPQARPAPRTGARVALALAVLLPLLAWWGRPRRREGTEAIGVADPARGRTLFAVSLALSFVLLVGAGWTGSSLPLLLDERGITQHDERPGIGSARAVRSDEWQVLAPLAISQAAHRPAFPRINTLHGAEGQNMLVVGMTGVPVAHPSALAKPATWGFFVFDLKRALAWHWWLPFFACFAVLWGFLQRFFALDWRLAAGLALTLVAAPYTVVFSGWPAYLVMFPVLGLLALDAALKSPGRWRPLAAGAMAGLAAAGFALVLYPAWQITLAWLLVPFALVWFVTRRHEYRLGVPQVAALALAATVAGLLMQSWWLDAHDAIAAIRATVYPGQRSMEAGGDIDRWFLVKGLLSPVTMYRDSSLMGGASDAGSVVLFLLPALAAVLWRWWARRRVDALSAVLCGYLVLAGCFMFIGFWPQLARWSLWGSATSYRLDLALGVAQLLLLAWLASPRTARPGDAPMPQILAASIALAVTLHAAWLFLRVPPAIMEVVPPSLAWLGAAGLAAGSYLLLRGRYRSFVAVLAAWTLAAALPFNPLGQAPSHVTPAAALAQGIAALPRGAGPGPGPIAVVAERNWAMALPAAGVPVSNSVFYVPPASLWRTLDPDGSRAAQYNRYQRLVIALEPQPGAASYRIVSPRLDEVHLRVDPVRFDFRRIGSAGVLASAGDAPALASNPGLRAVQTTAQWTLFAVAR